MGPFPGPQATHCFLDTRQVCGLWKRCKLASRSPSPNTQASRAFWGSQLVLTLGLTHHLLLLTSSEPSSEGLSQMQGYLPAHIWPTATCSKYTENFYQTYTFSCFYQDSQVKKANKADGIIPTIYRLCLLFLFS